MFLASTSAHKLWSKKKSICYTCMLTNSEEETNSICYVPPILSTFLVMYPLSPLSISTSNTVTALWAFSAARPSAEGKPTTPHWILSFQLGFHVWRTLTVTDWIQPKSSLATSDWFTQVTGGIDQQVYWQNEFPNKILLVMTVLQVQVTLFYSRSMGQCLPCLQDSFIYF